MKFVNVEYTGTKDYKDRTVLRNVWAPGDKTLVPEADAKILLRFAEFKLADSEPDEDAVATAKTVQIAREEVDKQEEQVREDMLVMIETMDKDALETYALKYDTNLDKRKKVTDLRLAVANLVDEFGAR